MAHKSALRLAAMKVDKSADEMVVQMGARTVPSLVGQKAVQKAQ